MLNNSEVNEGHFRNGERIKIDKRNVRQPQHLPHQSARGAPMPLRAEFSEHPWTGARRGPSRELWHLHAGEL